MRFSFCLATTFVMIATTYMTHGCAIAQNVQFMPGDAFFHSHLSKEIVDSLPENNSLTLNYMGAGNEANFCGYVGFARIKINHLSPEAKKALSRLYFHIRYYNSRFLREGFGENAKVQYSQEVDAPSVFIHNKTSKWSGPNRQVVGLRYNQDWDKIPSAGWAGKFKRSPKFYSCFIHDFFAIRQDLTFADRVDSLNVDVPSDVKWAWPSLEQYSTPVECDASDIQFIIVLGTFKLPSYERTELKRIFKGRETEFYSVKDANIYRYKVTKNGLKKTVGHHELGTSILRWEQSGQETEIQKTDETGTFVTEPDKEKGSGAKK